MIRQNLKFSDKKFTNTYEFKVYEIVIKIPTMECG